MGRDERMGELTRQRYTGDPYSQPRVGNNGLGDVDLLKKKGLVVEGVWRDVDRVVVWDANGSRSELPVRSAVVPGKRGLQTVFVPVSTR